MKQKTAARIPVVLLIVVVSLFVSCTNPASSGGTTVSVATPSFSLAAGTYEACRQISISCATSGATIYYTTDGSDPGSSASTRTAYSKPFILAQDTSVAATTVTLKAVAEKSGVGDSSAASATYVLTRAPTTAPVISPQAGTYAEVPDDGISLSAATGATIYYTTDGTDPTTASAVYSDAIAITGTTTIKAFSAYTGMPNSSIVSATYTIDADAIDMPTFSVSSGTYGENIEVELTSGDGSVYYTTDDSSGVTSWALYTDPIELTGSSSGPVTTTIRAKTIGEDNKESSVATATYTIAYRQPQFVIEPASGTITQNSEVFLGVIDNSYDGTPIIYYTTDGSDPTSSSTRKSIASFAGFVTFPTAEAGSTITLRGYAVFEPEPAGERIDYPEYSEVGSTEASATFTVGTEAGTGTFIVQ